MPRLATELTDERPPGRPAGSPIYSLPPFFLPAAPEPATILLVDDDRAGAGRVRALVEALGYRALVACTWSEALQVFMTREVDLVLMDAIMPTVDGFKLTRMFRERSRLYVPIVFLTVLTDDEARRRSIEAGADDMLAKPVDEVELAVRLIAMLRIRRLVRALADKSNALADLARIDALTGLLNRRMLDEHLPKEVERAQRYGRSLSLLMVDVDHFKRVNDTYGHAVGDQVLACLGRMLREELRIADRPYRYGGEELVVIAPETTTEGAMVLAERLRVMAFERTAAASPAGSQTLSVGVATLASLPPGADAQALREAADAALYFAKRSGRNRVAAHGHYPNE
jgi:diguanylate cyclase (GGDEF)-like protein